MSDDPTLDRRAFLANAALAGTALGTGALWTGCDSKKEAEKPEKPEQTEKSAPAKPAETSAKTREKELLARLESLKSLTAIDFEKLDGRPFEETLQAALDGGPQRLAWMIAPAGTALGIAAHGRGDDFGGAVSDYAVRMFGKDRAAVFDRLRMEAPAAAMDMEFVLARPSWFRVGIRPDSFEQLRGILRTLRAPKDVLETLLAYADIEGAEPRWLQMAKPSGTNGRLLTGTRLPADAKVDRKTDIIPEHVASRPVTVDVLSDSERRWLRTPGFQGQNLHRWQDARGLGQASAIARLDEIQETLSVDGPDWMAWERGKLQKTLVYGYDEEVGR